MTKLRCHSCENTTEHNSCYFYSDNSNIGRTRKITYYFCAVCHYVNLEEDNRMIFLVVAEDKVSYFKWEVDAIEYAKKHKSKVIADVIKE